MNRDTAAMPVAPRRRWPWWLLSACIALVLLVAITLRVALQPERAVPVLLDRLGEALGLEITAGGRAELVLRGTPTLVVRDVVARQPRAASPLLRAERILLSLPWSTLRARGATLDLVRIELDAPVLDLAALRRWLATRPPGETRMPTLRDGLRVRDGRVEAIGWHIDDIQAGLRELHPQRPLDATVRGRYVDTSTTLPFDLALAMTRPRTGAGVAVVGTLAVQRRDWQLPAQVRLSGPLHAGDGGLRIAPARLEMSGAYLGDGSRVPFVLGAHGPLRYADGVWTLAPAGFAMRAQSPLPSFVGRGALALGRRLVLRLAGTLPDWPAEWPALPPPLGDSSSPLPFALDYVGTANLADLTRLRLQRDAARFDARFRLPDVLAWIEDGSDSDGGRGDATPLPPLSGIVTAPELEIAGARLEGVEIVIEEPGVPIPDDRR